jgi:hypothetical protein
MLSAAAAVAMASTDPLLTEDIQEVAAQVSEQDPLGVPGRAFSSRSPLRTGFLGGVGALLAVSVAGLFYLAGRVLILMAVAGVVAAGLEPIVSWLTSGLSVK